MLTETQIALLHQRAIAAEHAAGRVAPEKREITSSGRERESESERESEREREAFERFARRERISRSSMGVSDYAGSAEHKAESNQMTQEGTDYRSEQNDLRCVDKFIKCSLTFQLKHLHIQKISFSIHTKFIYISKNQNESSQFGTVT